MIAVIDSGVANLASVMAALHRLKVDAEVTADAATIGKASHVILPGVGAAAPAMAQLQSKKLADVIRRLTQPVLGICLGMQLLFTGSEEGREPGERYVECLDVLHGMIKRMPSSFDRPIPHMGWNQIIPRQPSANPLLKDIAANSYAYFVHSYAVLGLGPDAIATTDYGGQFTSVAARGNFFGCQFHPERSGVVGSRILQNFLSI